MRSNFRNIIAALGVLFSVGLGATPSNGDSGILALSKDQARFETGFSFRFESTDLDMAYRDNAYNMSALDSLLNSVPAESIDSINVVTVSSPEGSYAYNVVLSKGRSLTAQSFLTGRYPTLTSLMRFSWRDEAWDELRTLILADESLSGTAVTRILGVIDAPSSIDTRKWRMARLSAYNYLLRNIYPQIRSLYVTVYYNAGAGTAAGTYTGNGVGEEAENRTAAVTGAGAESGAEAEIGTGEEVQQTAETGTEVNAEIGTEVEAEAGAEIEAETETEAESGAEDGTEVKAGTEAGAEAGTGAGAKGRLLCPPFAVKTNLLFDAALAFNGELEVPIGPKLSVNLEWTAPWWLDKGNTWCYQGNMGNIEGRWWWGDRSQRPMLSGWFTSVYLGTGRYDLQYNDKGRQGTFWNVGAGGGYAWSLGHNFGLEAMVGAGFFDTRFEQYVPRENYSILAYRRTLKTTWLGPTRAKISLYYKFGQRWYDRKYRHVNE